MRAVWKFPLELGCKGWQTVEVPGSPQAAVAMVALDPATSAPAVWLEVWPDSPHRFKRAFGIFPTGGRLAENAAHVGSLIDGSFVWHIYERIQ